MSLTGPLQEPLRFPPHCQALEIKFEGGTLSALAASGAGIAGVFVQRDGGLLLATGATATELRFATSTDLARLLLGLHALHADMAEREHAAASRASAELAAIFEPASTAEDGKPGAAHA